MARYRKIDVVMWNDQKFRRLSGPPPNGKSCWQYLLTNPETSNIPGVYRAFSETLARGLGWTPEAFREAFQEAFREGMAKADWEVGFVFIPGAAKYNKPESPNVVRGWSMVWHELPECRLKLESWEHLKAFTEALGEGFAKAFGEACPKPLPNQEQEQEQDQVLLASPKGAALSLFSESSSQSLSEAAPVDQVRVPRPDVAVGLLAELSAARKRVNPKVRDITVRATSLTGIRARIKGGATPDDVRHVIAVYEAESRANPKSAEYFDAVSPFRPDNFERALAKAPTTGSILEIPSQYRDLAEVQAENKARLEAEGAIRMAQWAAEDAAKEKVITDRNTAVMAAGGLPDDV
jgi:hypothetical protein